MRGRPLSDTVQRLLVQTYRIETGELQLADYIIGDRRYRERFAGCQQLRAVDSADGFGARTLLREDNDQLRACIYFPDAMIRRLERFPPSRGLDERNVEAFAGLVEEIDHLLCLVEAARTRRAVSLFELELHANLSKYLVLARYLAGRRRRLDSAARGWLRHRLFDGVVYDDPDPAVRARYTEAARWSVRWIEAIRRMRLSRRVDALRRFHRATAGEKLRLVESF